MEGATAITSTIITGATGDSKQLKVTKADIAKFQALTQFIIDKVGLEPQWSIRIKVDPDLIEVNNLAEVLFDSIYMTAEISFHPINVVNRAEWVGVLLHEVGHLLVAELDEWGQPTHKAANANHAAAAEKSVSMIERVLGKVFEAAYFKEYKQWL